MKIAAWLAGLNIGFAFIPPFNWVNIFNLIAGITLTVVIIFFRDVP